MNTRDMRSQLTNLKLHIDEIDSWMSQAMKMVHDLEEKIMDYEDSVLDMLVAI